MKYVPNAENSSISSVNTDHSDSVPNTVVERGGIKIKRRRQRFIFPLSVLTAEQTLTPEKTTLKNIAVIRVTSLKGSVIPINKDQFKSEKDYRIALNIAKMMLSKGLIDEEDYRSIDTILIKKYEPTLGSLSFELT